MKRKSFLFAMGCLSAMFLLQACTQKFPGYQKTDSGLYYKFYNQNPEEAQPKVNDYIKVQMVCYLHDAVYYDFQTTRDGVYTQIKAPYFAGDLEEAYAMMHVGDSASFYVKADSIAVRYYGKNPAEVGLKADDYFRYEVKLLDFLTPEQIEAEVDKAMQQIKADAEMAFLNYIKENNVTEYTPSGLFYTKLLKTNGKAAENGMTAKVKYTVSLLDGTFVGSSDSEGEYFEVQLGRHAVLRGLEEGIAQMRVGEKARLVIPYTLAYGDKTYRNIPAYSNLIFDVELIDLVNITEQ